MTASSLVIPAESVPFTTAYVDPTTSTVDTMLIVAAIAMDIPRSTWASTSCGCSTVAEGSVINFPVCNSSCATRLEASWFVP